MFNVNAYSFFYSDYQSYLQCCYSGRYRQNHFRYIRAGNKLFTSDLCRNHSFIYNIFSISIVNLSPPIPRKEKINSEFCQLSFTNLESRGFFVFLYLTNMSHYMHSETVKLSCTLLTPTKKNTYD